MLTEGTLTSLRNGEKLAGVRLLAHSQVTRSNNASLVQGHPPFSPSARSQSTGTENRILREIEEKKKSFGSWQKESGFSIYLFGIYI